VKLPSDLATAARTHPTFIELGTNKPLYVHRHGSNVFNGEYTVDYDPRKTIGHYSAFRRIDVAGLRRQYEAAKAMKPEDAVKGSPLQPGAGVAELPRFFAAPANAPATTGPAPIADRVAHVIAALNERGYWPTKLGSTSHPFREGPVPATSADFSQTNAGDELDTSPYNDDVTIGISTAGYIENMSVLIRFVDGR
jgi:hypothetical protein